MNAKLKQEGDALGLLIFGMAAIMVAPALGHTFAAALLAASGTLLALAGILKLPNAEG